MSDPNPTRTQMPSTETTQAEPSNEWPTRDKDGRFLPKNPGPLKHGLRSELVRSGQMLEADKSLVERRDRVRDGDMSDVRTSLANSFVAADVIASGFAARIAMDGPLTGKGHARSLVFLWLKVSEHRNRLAQLLGYEPPTEADRTERPDVSHYTDEELDAIGRIVETAKARAAAPVEPPAEPPIQRFRIELPSEDTP